MQSTQYVGEVDRGGLSVRVEITVREGWADQDELGELVATHAVQGLRRVEDWRERAQLATPPEDTPPF